MLNDRINLNAFILDLREKLWNRRKIMKNNEILLVRAYSIQTVSNLGPQDHESDSLQTEFERQAIRRESERIWMECD